jgi:membrane protease subunit (stomatin/prohibitin family)
MGILKRQVRSVIEWTNPSTELLFDRWSENGDEIKNASKLIVGPGQGCLFVYEGRIEAVYAQEGMVDLRTDNIPFVTTLSRVMQAFVSEHKASVYFFKTARMLNLRWGTPSPVKYEDPHYKLPVALRAFGNYSIRIADAAACFRQVVGGKDSFLIDEVRESLNARLIQPLADYLAEARLSYTEIDPKREEIAAALSARLAKEFLRLGFELEDFRIQGTSFDEDTMRRINRIADVSAEAQAASSAGVTFSELQRLTALHEAARSSGSANTGMAMAVGMNMGGVAMSPAAAIDANDDLATSLHKLKVLLEQGLISQGEYDAKKQEVLARL